MQQKSRSIIKMYGFLYYELIIMLAILSLITMTFGKSLSSLVDLLMHAENRCSALDVATYHMDRCITRKECPTSDDPCVSDQYQLQYDCKRFVSHDTNRTFSGITLTVVWYTPLGVRQHITLFDGYYT